MGVRWKKFSLREFFPSPLNTQPDLVESLLQSRRQKLVTVELLASVAIHSSLTFDSRQFNTQ